MILIQVLGVGNLVIILTLRSLSLLTASYIDTLYTHRYTHIRIYTSNLQQQQQQTIQMPVEKE